MTNETTGGRKPPITPHKGGRTARIDIRVTPEVKELAARLAAKRGCSVADLIEALLRKAA